MIDTVPLPDDIFLSVKLAGALADWKRMSDAAEQHPGSVRPEDLGAAWERTMDLLDQWMLSS